MNIAVLGTGGRPGDRRSLHGLGHSVVGTSATRGPRYRTEPDQMGNPPFSAWHSAHPGVEPASFADAAAGADLVVNASSGAATSTCSGSPVPTTWPARCWSTSPTRWTSPPASRPPCSSRTPTPWASRSSAFPQAKVVKVLNTLNASLMVEPKSLGESSTVFVSGEDPAAKATVVEILESFGHDDVIDLGGIETARGTEMLLPIWLRLMGALGTAQFNFKVVR